MRLDSISVPPLENDTTGAIISTSAVIVKVISSPATALTPGVPSCEISITCCLGYDYKGKDDYNWGMFVGPANGKRGEKGKHMKMQPGDGVIYRGCEIEHWREPFEVSEDAWQVQVFLHYVNKNGPYGDLCKYDFRPALGLTDVELVDEDKKKAANELDMNTPEKIKDSDFPKSGSY